MSDTTEAPKKTTLSITVDGQAHEAQPGQLVIDAAEDAGVYVPRFCYHPRMSPVGMCRQCLVEVQGPRGPMMVVSCMTPVAEGQVVVTDSPAVKKAQEGVLEFLLANHPLDCPVCDKGGECPLQDQAFSHGPGESRFVEEKRHYEKPIPISELVFLDRERCILCDRCTRFAKEVAGDPLIHFTHRGNNTQVQTFPDAPFSSYFAGNTVQICPVGALTASPYRFKARPWDLDQTESTCTTCSVGCRVTVQASRNELLRYQGVDSDPVNWGWLCDRGRFDFEAVNADTRLRGPLVRKGDKLQPATWSEAYDAAADALKLALRNGGPASIGVLGGARGTNEDAYAWAKLAKAVLGTDNVDAQMGDGLPAEVVLGLPRATIDQAAAATTLVLLGPDLKEELPVLYLRVHDAAEKRTIRILELSTTDTGLTPYAWKSLRYRPGEQAALVRAVLGNGDKNAVGVAEADLAEARAQLEKGSVVVIAGRASLSESADFTVEAVNTLHQAFPEATFLTALRRGNVFGALDAGLAPGLAPGRVSSATPSDALAAAWPSVAAGPGLDARGILEAAAAGRIAALVLVGADPLADFPDKALAAKALAGATRIIAIDTHPNASNATADVVLAAAAYAERAGTTTNLEGRVSRLSQKVTPVGTSQPDWIIASELAFRLGGDLGFVSVESILDELRTVSVVHAEVTDAALKASHDGVLASGSSITPALGGTVPLPVVNAYDLRLVVSRKLFDAAVGTAQSHSLAGLAPGTTLAIHPLDAEQRGFASGASVRVTAVSIDSPDKRRSLVLPVRHSTAVPRGVVWAAFNQPDVSVSELIDVAAPVTDVRVETL